MKQKAIMNSMSILLTSIFIVFFIFFASNLFQSSIYDVLLEDAFISWLALIIVLLAGISTIVASHSFIYFMQEGKLGDLFYSICGIDIFILSFLYFISHEVNVFPFPFSPSKEKNVTIVVIMAFFIGSSVVFNAFFGRKDKKKREVGLIFVTGLIIIPIVAFLFAVAPQPAFLLTTSEGFTLTGLFVTFAILVFLIVGIVKNVREFRKASNYFALAQIYACIIWIFSIIYFGIQTLSFQMYEIFGLASMLAGFSFIAVSMIAGAIVEPHRSLKKLISERTSELQSSVRESEYYLNMWSHEVGNMLQGVVGALDVVTLEMNTDANELLNGSFELIRRLSVSTHQIRMIARMKAVAEEKSYPFDIYSCIIDAVNEVQTITSMDELEIRINFDNDVIWVKANEFLSGAIFNLISYITKRDPEISNMLSIDIVKSESHVDLCFTRNGFSLSEDIIDSLRGSLQPKTTMMGLDLFSAKMVTQQLGGELRYTQVDINKNQFVIHIPTTKLIPL
ncbi:MAG: hypothetical protein E4H14_02110 [Candidatus Thorarchaeota archaeon]|nr:MAG: hypothetical protein E4H14_02110 [Candidatus Thorarchaeota archaeon]